MQTIKTYSYLVLLGVQDVIGSTPLTKLMGIAADGAATMLGRGFSRHIVDACASVGAQGIAINWCASHQLNLAVDNWLAVFDKIVDFRSTLGYETSLSRTRESIRQTLGWCSMYATARWTSINDACQFLKRHRDDLLQLYTQKGRVPSSSA